ncbi:response regulator [Sphingomonas sp. MAH-20]|uniref:Response regulator n=1 Tax=Sphingomonas horti TaxID=2682842 RepID=A0A6I4J005_9SPHN|nr:MULTISPECIES: response regulator [Sphingomonas]MBA2920668.1 response regulator [Sphingomonas sp. CGMCC 1.13658]MVO77604.1 response regulator [Sphingomonas horti]
MDNRKVIAVIDDDESVRESLPDLLRSFGFDARPFASAEAFLESVELEIADCLVLDVTMPGMTGPGLQQELERRRHDIPIVFITAHSDENAWHSLLSSGAAACLIKPFSESAILDAIRVALRSE